MWMDLSRICTRTIRDVDKKIVGVDIVPKVSELSFENDTIRNTVPILFRHIGNENDKTITKRQNDTKIHACQRTRRYQVPWCNTSIIFHTRYHVSMEFTEWS